MKFLRFALAAILVTPLATPAQDLAKAAALVDKRFQQLDADRDGKLSAIEAKPAAQWVTGADADQDGFLTLDEVRNHLRGRLASLVEGRRGSQPADVSQVEEKAPPLLEMASPREAARRLKAGDCGIGTLMPDGALVDLDGGKHSLRELTADRPAVIALVSTSCPVSKRYGPTLARLEQEYRARGVGFLLIAQNPTDAPDELRAALKSAGSTAPLLRDPEQALLQALGATASTDVFLLDAARTLIYRGAVDDQYGLGYSLDAPRHRYLATALEALLAGKTPEIAATEAPGCALDLGGAKTTAATDATYHNRISRLVQTNCQECHRAGGVAPFALETYEQVTAKSGMIRKMVSRGLMPPWFAAAPAPGTHSPWGNDRSLVERDRGDLLAWLDAGKPLGDAKDAPVPRVFPKEWQIGVPDAVVQLPQPIEVQAEGTMPYQMATVTTSFAEDRWVRGIEIQPTAREVVHHVLVFVQERGGRFAGEQAEGGGFFAAYVPGNDHTIYPSGFAKLLPAGAKLRFQIHYTPNGTATRDQLKMAFLFTPEAPEHTVRVASVGNHRLNIPPGAAHHAESATIPIPAEVKLLAFMPHMHVRGAAFRYEAILPDGTVRTLLDVPRYDFNWQLSYRYAEPPTLPVGAKIRATGWYDNSANNPANPDPTKTVRWGPQTFDEMMLGYVEYYVPGEKRPAKTAAR